MTQSASRTIIIGATSPGGIYGILPFAGTLRWSMAEPGDNLDYYLDVTRPLADVGDTIASASLSVSPSGTGELQAANLTVNGSVIGWWGSGGVAGRNYLVRIDAVTAGGRTFEWFVGLLVDPRSGRGRPCPPPSAGYGTAITWTASGLPVGIYGQTTYGGSVYG